MYSDETLKALYEYIGGITALKCDFDTFRDIAKNTHVDSYYTCWTIPKKNGAPRHIEAPSDALKLIQRALIPLFRKFPLGEHVHGLGGFKHDAYSNAMEHYGNKVVVQMDIKDFFPSTTNYQLYWAIQSNAHVLQELVPLMLHASAFCLVRDKSGVDRLPMGAPTSPILANIAFSDTDVSLKAICATYGYTYTRYMDDLTFSGGHYVPNFQKTITTAVEGSSVYKMNHKKSQISWQGNNQQRVTGVVINTHQSVGRVFKKKLRAELDHHAKKSSLGADLTPYLQGKLAYMQRISPQQTLKMKKYFVKRLQFWNSPAVWV